MKLRHYKRRCFSTRWSTTGAGYNITLWYHDHSGNIVYGVRGCGWPIRLLTPLKG
jgi:hypothetical protein